MILFVNLLCLSEPVVVVLRIRVAGNSLLAPAFFVRGRLSGPRCCGDDACLGQDFTRQGCLGPEAAVPIFDEPFSNVAFIPDALNRRHRLAPAKLFVERMHAFNLCYHEGYFFSPLPQQFCHGSSHKLVGRA